MKSKLVNQLICPECKSSFHICDLVEKNGEIETGVLKCKSEHSYNIVKGVPRFTKQNYGNSFGVEWNENKLTQHDSSTKSNTFQKRFSSYTGWTQDELKGKKVLEVGCGAGPFVEICSKAGSEMFAIDISNAVDACYENHGKKQNVHVIMADANNLPFDEESFDYIFSIGVLHHTPNPRKSFESILRYLNASGKIAVWVYRKPLLGIKPPICILRGMLFRHLPPKLTYKIVQIIVPILLPIKRFVSKIPFLGKFIRPFLLVADYDGIYNISKEDLLKWSVLDTFDRLTPMYVHYHTPHEVKGWFEKCRLQKINENNVIVGENANYKGFAFLKKSNWGIAFSGQRPVSGNPKSNLN